MIKRTLLLAMLPILAHAEDLPAPVKAIEKQGITILSPSMRREA
ncbi:disulfide isomerase/thiol-disulfide oxidase [Salmonella bongori]|nr:disulfide isomerase/thiol-disulfide oxidase [Salmonella bongori]